VCCEGQGGEGGEHLFVCEHLLGHQGARGACAVRGGEAREVNTFLRVVSLACSFRLGAPPAAAGCLLHVL